MTQRLNFTKRPFTLSTKIADPPPELTNYVANAYNAKEGNFLSKPVFALSYNEGKTVGWGPDSLQKDIPDQISTSIATNHHEVKTSLFLESKADYDRSFSASVEAEFSGVSFSGSAQSSMLYHGSLFTSTSSFYALNFYLQDVLTFERKDSTLDSNFAEVIKALPVDNSYPDYQKKYFDFFDSYGTHYTHFGTMGGTIVMETDIRQSLLENASESEISAAVSLGYEGVVVEGKLDVGAAYKNSEFLSKNRSSIRISLHVMGGLYASEESFHDWMASIYKTPSLLLTVPALNKQVTTLKCISKLVAVAGGNPQIAENIESLIHNYVMKATLDDGSLLTSPSPLVFDRVYNTASGGIEAGDGFVICSIENTNNGDRGYIEAFESTDSDPTTIRATASQHVWANDDIILPAASLTMPTPSYTNFTLHKTATWGQPNTRLNFIGLGNIGEKQLGSWQDVGIYTTHIAPADGFVVAFVDWNGADEVGSYIQGFQDIDGSSRLVASASQHYNSVSGTFVPTNSFCMPVCKGTRYRLYYIDFHSETKAQAFFVPLSDKYVFFEGFQTRRPGFKYQALTDGFLVANLSAAFDKPTGGEHGSVELYSYPNSNDIARRGKLASTSVHVSPNLYDVWIPGNSAMIPISKNNYYIANFSRTWGNPDIQLLWMPLGVKK